MTLLASMFAAATNGAFFVYLNAGTAVIGNTNPFQAGTSFGANTGITVSTNQMTVPAGTWIMFWMSSGSVGNGGSPIQQKQALWEIYNVTAGTAISPQINSSHTTRVYYNTLMTTSFAPIGMLRTVFTASQVLEHRLKSVAGGGTFDNGGNGWWLVIKG